MKIAIAYSEPSRPDFFSTDQALLRAGHFSTRVSSAQSNSKFIRSMSKRFAFNMFMSSN